MKLLIIVLCILLGIIIGFFPDIKKPKPLYWKILLLIIVSSSLIVNFIIPIPQVITLGELIRIMNFHVPTAWVAVLGFSMSMIYSIIYLKNRNIEYDILASSSASLGMIFCILATLTGMVWAKYNWGAYWNWDPRQTSIFILLIIYFAYFSLRTALENQEQKARLSAVYSILAFVTVPFLVFIIPRLSDSLHPGSALDNGSGPILSTEAGSINFLLLLAFSYSMTAFTVIYFWLLNLRIRLKKIENYSQVINI